MQRVTESVSYSGSRSLEAVSDHGGCWGAIANAPIGTLPTDQSVRFSGAVKPGVEGSFGCHSNSYADVKLQTSAEDWSAGTARELLQFSADKTLTGSGLDLGTFQTGEWTAYTVQYTHRQSDEEVDVAYEINRESRGSTTVAAIDAETDLTYISFSSGDFTGYWDDVVAETIEESTSETATETTTPTPTPTPTPTATSTPTLSETTTPTPSAEYDLRDGNKVIVRPHDTPLYVITDIPDVDPNRRAVTTADYDLVGQLRAMDGLTAAVYRDRTQAVEYSDRLETAREHKERAKELQFSGRFIDAGWDVTIILNSLLAGRPDLGVGSAMALTTDLISWGYTEQTTPFEEGFSKMTAALTNARSIETKASRMRENNNLGAQIQQMVSAFMLGKDVVTTGVKLSTAWDEAVTALRGSRFPVHATDDALRSADDLAAHSVDDAVSASAGLFVGFAIGTAVGEITSPIKAKTKIHTAEIGYETVRIPLLKRLQAFQTRARDGLLTHPQAIEYEIGKAAELQMGAILFQIGADYWEAISDMTLGVWDAMVNANTKATNYAERAASLETASKWQYIGLGATGGTIRQQWDNSINNEALTGGDR